MPIRICRENLSKPYRSMEKSIPKRVGNTIAVKVIVSRLQNTVIVCTTLMCDSVIKKTMNIGMLQDRKKIYLGSHYRPNMFLLSPECNGTEQYGKI